MAFMLVIGCAAVIINYKIYSSRSNNLEQVQNLRKENELLTKELKKQKENARKLEDQSKSLKSGECAIDDSSSPNVIKERKFRAKLDKYTQLHKDIIAGEKPPRFVQCVLINGWGNVFQEAVSCMIFAMVSHRAVIFNTRNIEGYMPFREYLPVEHMPFNGYRMDLLGKYKEYIIPRFNLTCLDFNVVSHKELVTIHLTYDWFAPNILINPYHGEAFLEDLPPNYFQVIFEYLWDIKQDLKDELMEFKQKYFGKFTVGIQIRHPTINQKGEKDHKGFPVPPPELYVQAAEQLSRFQTKVDYKDVVWFVATQNTEIIKTMQDSYGKDKVVWFNRTITTTFDPHPEGQRVSIQTWWLLGECEEVITTEASSYGITAGCRTGRFPIVCTHNKFCFRRLSQTPCQDTPFLPDQPEDCLLHKKKKLHQFLTSPENSCGYFKWQIYTSPEYHQDSWNNKGS